MDNNNLNKFLSEENASGENNGGKRDPFNRVFDWVEMLALYFSIGLILIILFFKHSPVVGNSMNPTLSNGDILIVSTFMYTPKANDIIVCQSESYGLEKPLVKRIIATEGQTVKIDYKSWTVTVDGKVLEEDYIKREADSMRGSNYLPETFTVPENCVFVMGDNRNGSSDSRIREIGFIDERYILGKVAFRIAPVTKFKFF
jgi:signal peptidase I